jgi:hypothetical protein
MPCLSLLPRSPGGEHYCINVVADIPFTLVVQKLAQVQTLRNRCSFSHSAESQCNHLIWTRNSDVPRR